MARKKKRSWGRGSIARRGQGITIRWREKAIDSAGRVRTIHRCEQLGDVTMTEAMESLNQRRTASAEPKPQPVTFSEFASSWKANVLPTYPKYSTKKHHRYIVDSKLIPHFGKFTLHRITGEHVQQFIRELEIQGVAPHSIRHYRAVLSTLFNTAIKWKRLAENPASGVRLPALKPVREQWVFTFDQARALLEKLTGRAHVSVSLAFGTGMRRGELFAVRWQCFDPDARTLFVAEAIYDHEIGDPKTSDSRRLIPLSNELVQLLTVWRSRTKYSKPTDFILAGRMGIAGDHARILRDHVKPACAVQKLKTATWLTFRRTWATWADEKGVSAKMRGAMMGNSAEINERIYTKVIPDSLRAATQSVGSELYASCSQTPNSIN